MSFANNIRRTNRLEARRFTVEQVEYQLPSGEPMVRDVVRHPGAVVIVPILADGRVVLIRNYRIAVEQELVELPAGTLDRDEPLIDTARRELIEETGYRPGKLELLCELCMSPGILDEKMHVFVAHSLTVGEQALELGEQITTLPTTIEELDKMMVNGEIRDSKTISALLYYLRYGQS